MKKITYYKLMNYNNNDNKNMLNYKTSLNKGFSLYEIMIVLLIASILMATAIPSFTKIISTMKKDSAFDVLNSAIYLGKTYAINNRQNVYLTVGSKGTSSSWESIKLYTSDTVILDIELDGYKIKPTSSISFNMNGQVFSTSNSLPALNSKFCIFNDVTNNSKYILSINYLGKTKFEEKNECN